MSDYVLTESKILKNKLSVTHVPEKKGCVFCGEETETVYTYKSYWFICKTCGNAIRCLRSRFPLDRMRFLKPLFSPWARTRLWLVEDTSQPGGSAITYDLYANIVKRNQGVVGTKWEYELANLEQNMGKLGLKIEGPVLDISGGPGFLVAELSKRGIDATVTEYNKTSVEGIKKNLGINAVVFDHNSQSINKIFDRKFKTVLIRHNINFCRNLEKFSDELSCIVSDGGIVYADSVLPTLGACIRWQHDDYIYECLWNPETIRLYFERAGFELIARTPFEAPYLGWAGEIAGFPPRPDIRQAGHYKKPGLMRSIGKSVLHINTMTPYILRELMRGKSMNRSLYQKYIGYVLRKK